MRNSFLVSGTVLGAFCAIALFAGLRPKPIEAKPASQPQPVLVELFTSEGCSSCPPADSLLAELDRKQSVPGASVVVLSEHVDDWNYLGWRDPYSSSQWSERQNDYAWHFHIDGPYTPQMIIDGAHQVVGNDSRAVRQAIEESAAQPKIPIDISSAEKTSDTFNITFTAGAAPNTRLYAVLADDSDRSSVQRGENSGRTLDHVAVARSLSQVATLQNTPTEKTIQIKIPQGDPNRHLRLILFAQEGKSNHIVGVAAREL